MNFLRKAVTRLNGQISVATKPGRYTQFLIQLPPLSASRDSEAEGEAEPDGDTDAEPQPPAARDLA